MKAVRIHEHGGPEVLTWDEMEAPSCPPGKILLEVKAASINHLDLWVRKGFPGIELPLIMGSDASGVIAEVGSEVTGWNSGDEVMVQPGIY